MMTLYKKEIFLLSPVELIDSSSIFIILVSITTTFVPSLSPLSKFDSSSYFVIIILHLITMHEM